MQASCHSREWRSSHSPSANRITTLVRIMNLLLLLDSFVIIVLAHISIGVFAIPFIQRFLFQTYLAFEFLFISTNFVILFSFIFKIESWFAIPRCPCRIVHMTLEMLLRWMRFHLAAIRGKKRWVVVFSIVIQFNRWIMNGGWERWWRWFRSNRTGFLFV